MNNFLFFSAFQFISFSYQHRRFVSSHDTVLRIIRSRRYNNEQQSKGQRQLSKMTKNHQQAQRRNSDRDRDRPHSNDAGTRRSSLHVFVVPIEKNVNTRYRKKNWCRYMAD